VYDERRLSPVKRSFLGLIAVSIVESQADIKESGFESVMKVNFPGQRC
jgi:hypothetical protein